MLKMYICMTIIVFHSVTDAYLTCPNISNFLGVVLLPSLGKLLGDPGADLDLPCVKLLSHQSGGTTATAFCKENLQCSSLFFL